MKTRKRSAEQAEIIKQEAIKIAAQSMQEEFEAYFGDDLENAYAKLQEVTNALPEDVLITTLLQDNRLYLYEILLDNSTEEIVDNLISLVKKQ